MKFSLDEMKKREGQVSKLIAASPEMTDKAVNEKMKKLTGHGVGGRLVKKMRAEYQKSQAKFSDGKSKPLNGTHGPQVPVAAARPVVRKEEKVAYKPSTKAPVETIGIDQATEMLKPALRNIEKIMRACPVITIVGMRREGGKIEPFGMKAKVETTPLELSLT